MSRLYSAAVPLLLSGAILLTLYVGSYAFLVKTQASPVDPLNQPRVARYRFGGVVAETIFFPVEQADRKLRHKYWITPDCLRDWEG